MEPIARRRIAQHLVRHRRQLIERRADGRKRGLGVPPPGVTRCPTNIGANSFPAGTYSPSTNRYYLPIMDSCMGKMGDTPARFLALDLNFARSTANYSKPLYSY